MAKISRVIGRELSWICVGAGVLGLVCGRRRWGAAALAAAGLVRVLEKRASAERWRGARVVVTGGSRGLGFALARELVARGASVAVVARDGSELDRAERLLRAQGAPGSRVLGVACDVTDRVAFGLALGRVEEAFGGIDTLVNNAGSIASAPYRSTRPEDYRALMEIHLFAVLSAVDSVVPMLKRAGGGNIVNISSIGGLVPVPHLAPYCASKHALAGLSETLAIELAPEGVTVTTVYPGLMRTGSTIQAVFKGQTEKEYAWFTVADSLPLLTISARRAARQILTAAGEGRSQITLTVAARALAFGHAILPGITHAVLRLTNACLPGGKNPRARTGAASSGLIRNAVWAWPFRKIVERAQRSLNQTPKFDADFNMNIR